MTLPLGNRRRTQTSTTTLGAQHQQSQTNSQSQTPHQQQQSTTHPAQQQQFRCNVVLMRKQQSFIETGRCRTLSESNRRPLLHRGISVDRSLDTLKQKSISNDNKVNQGLHYIRKNLTSHSIDQDNSFRSKGNIPNSKDFPSRGQRTGGYNFRGPNNNRTINGVGGCGGGGVGVGIGTLRDRSIVHWSSTSSLLKTVSEELDEAPHGINGSKHFSTLSVDACGTKDHKTKQNRSNDNCGTSPGGSEPSALTTTNGDTSKINLNIFLSQTIKAISTEYEAAHSDIDSSSEGADIVGSLRPVKQANNQPTPKYTGAPNTNHTLIESSHHSSGSYRRQPNRKEIATNETSSVPNQNNLSTTVSSNTNVSPSLQVQRRPPLVRAMSAPVRTLEETSKSVIMAGKRKNRNRKLNPRNISSDRNHNSNGKDILLNGDFNGVAGSKKVLSRARSMAAPDVITLVSLISSEGSDSEKEETSPSASTSNSDNSPTRRAPLLRKTGKSVSFQENFPPNFQLAAKEYTQMIRRSSIAPLAARLRTNRPPTAPAISIFLTDTNSKEQPPNVESENINIKSIKRATTNEQGDAMSNEKENKTKTDNVQDYTYPEYVRSIKERECWKLYQKMCAKGVNVTYDTILRGMLTPTEFRQLQKQRDIEDAKAQAINAIEVPVVTKPISAIERLSEALLKK